MDLAPVTTWSQWEILNFEIHLKKTKNMYIFMGPNHSATFFFFTGLKFYTFLNICKLSICKL